MHGCSDSPCYFPSHQLLGQIWTLPDRKFNCSLVGHSNWVRTACFNDSANLVATGSDDKLVKLWDVPTHQALHTFHDFSE
jgi:centriolar protein POC1